jgi:hypothetical protein
MRGDLAGYYEWEAGGAIGRPNDKTVDVIQEVRRERRRCHPYY